MIFKVLGIIIAAVRFILVRRIQFTVTVELDKITRKPESIFFVAVFIFDKYGLFCRNISRIKNILRGSFYRSIGDGRFWIFPD